MRRRKQLVALAAGTTLVLCAAAAELSVRAAGYALPVRPQPSRADPVIHQPDPVLGWRAKPGGYVFPPYSPGSQPVRMTIWPDGSRATERQPPHRPEGAVLAVLGDSFALGWAVSDEETYPWKLHDRFPRVNVRNFGTAGYNTQQAILRLEAAHRENGFSPTLVLYSFGADQERRNVAAYDWINLLDAITRGEAAVPYCLLGPEGLACHAPFKYPLSPLREWSVAVNLLADRYVLSGDAGRLAQASAVTEELLARLDETSRGMGAALVIVLLEDRSTAAYAERLRERGLRYIDCADPLGAIRIVRGDGHPNAKVHTFWADCVADAIRGDLEPF